MSKTKFEDLDVYRLSEELSDEVWHRVSLWKPFARDTVGKQVVRAVDGIGANIAEGIGRYSYADNRRFVLMARGSLYETRHWLRRAYKRGLLSKDDVRILAGLVDKLAPVLAGYLASLTRRINEKE